MIKYILSKFTGIYSVISLIIFLIVGAYHFFIVDLTALKVEEKIMLKTELSVHLVNQTITKQGEKSKFNVKDIKKTDLFYLRIYCRDFYDLLSFQSKDVCDFMVIKDDISN